MGNSQNSSNKKATSAPNSTGGHTNASNNNNNNESPAGESVASLLAAASHNMLEKRYNLRLVDAIEEQDLEAVLAALQTSAGKADLNEKISSSIAAETPLMLAISTGNVEIVKALIDAGAQHNAKNKDGAVAVHLACQSGVVELVKMFVPLCGLEVKDYSHNTPLVYAATHGHVPCVEYLIEKGAHVNTASTDLITPLMSVSRRGDTTMTECLIRKGANVDAPDKWGRTALFHSARAGTLPTMKLLVELGRCNVSHKDNYGNDAFWMAESRSMYECALYLFAHGAQPSSIIKSRGFGSEVTFSRPMLRGDVPTPRTAPYAFAKLRDGKRIVIAGGMGIMEGTVWQNNLEATDTAGCSTGWNSDLYYVDLDSMEEEYPFVSQQMASFRQFVNNTASKGKWGLSAKKRSHRISVESDGVTATFTGSFDPACIQADFGFKKSSAPFGYWELTILSLGTHSMITMGVATDKYKVDAHPGWYPDSFALHGDDGQVFFNVGAGNIWGPRYAEGDVIGCGVNFLTREVWFTRNGKFLGVAFRNVDLLLEKTWFPVMGMTSPGEKAKANFGAYPFAFTFDAPMLQFVKPKLNPSPSGITFPAGIAAPEFHQIDDRHLIFTVLSPTLSQGVISVCKLDTETWSFVDELAPGIIEPASDLPTNVVPLKFHTSFMDSSRKIVFVATASQEQVHFFKLDCSTWTVSQEGLLHTAALSNLFNGLNQLVPLVVRFVGPFFYIWHPLGNQAYRIRYEQDVEHSSMWEEVEFEGTVTRTTHYSVCSHAPHRPSTLFVFAGWDDNAQSNSFFIIDIVERHTGEKDESGFNITKPVFVWSKPHREGTVPRPRNDTGLFSINESTLLSFGGWNGRNYVEDLEIIHIQKQRACDPLGSLVTELAREIYDVEINLRDGKTIQTNKIVLYCRSSYFRSILDKDPNVASIDLSTVPYPAFVAAGEKISYSYVMESESVPFEVLRLFMDGVVQRFAPEHFNRIGQELFAATVLAVSTLGKDLEKYGWNNPLFADIQFEVESAATGEMIRFSAHRAILCARSQFFHALCMGGLKESRQHVITIKETSPEAFGAVLIYLYSQSVDFEAVEPFIVELLLAASQYDVSGLKSVLEGVIAQSLTLDNVAPLFITADQIQAQRLREACAAFIRSNEQALQSVPEFVTEKFTIESIMKTMCK